MKIDSLPHLAPDQSAQAKLVVAIPENAVNPQGPQQLYGLSQLFNVPKLYRAKLTQIGEAHPDVVEFVNTLGCTAVWTRNSEGNYFLTLGEAQDTAKTFVLVGQLAGIAGATVGVTFGGLQLLITTSDDGVLADSLLDGTPIELAVYP